MLVKGSDFGEGLMIEITSRCSKVRELDHRRVEEEHKIRGAKEQLFTGDKIPRKAAPGNPSREPLSFSGRRRTVRPFAATNGPQSTAFPGCV
jgi:hypothetical protein